MLDVLIILLGGIAALFGAALAVVGAEKGSKPTLIAGALITIGSLFIVYGAMSEIARQDQQQRMEIVDACRSSMQGFP